MGRKTQIKCSGSINRFEEVASFIYDRFGNSIKYIADVAGGQGMLSRILNKKYNYESEVIDPRHYQVVGVKNRESEYYSSMADYYDLIVGLHPDEATYDLINNEQGEFYNIFADRVNNYLKKKTVEIVNAGANVILDWGFWTKEDRLKISEYFKSHNINYEWHYISIDDETSYKKIEERNKRIEEGNGGSDFYVDEGLMNKLLSMFETPNEEEMDVVYKVKRK